MTRTLGALLLAILVAGWAGPACAVYIQSVDVYQYAIGEPVSWTHTFDFSEIPPLWATLTIVADDVDGPFDTGDDGENDAVYLNGNLLGYLTQLPAYSNWDYFSGPGNPDQPLTTTEFNIAPALLDWSMPISVSVEAFWGVEIETSTLTVRGGVPPIPEASTILLFGAGLLGLGALRLRKR